MPPPAGYANSRNGLIHSLYVRQDFDECLKIIEEVLAENDNKHEFCLHTKALIKRQQGKIQESLTLFQAATAMAPSNPSNLKQVGRSLFLLGKHKAAIDVYDEALRMGVDDWETWHNKGLCHMYLKQLDTALECFRRANQIQPHDTTYMQMGKVYTMQEDHQSAVDIYGEALEHSPENTDILTTLGVLYLRMGDNYKAFDCLGTSLQHDAKNPRTILAAASIIQDHADLDVALIKYRVAAVLTPNSPQLWNNIGMCFFAKQRYIAAIACLKRGLYLGPFEWIVSYNLGLVHLNTGQWASAFHHLSAAINIKPDFPHSYMYLAVCLAKLDDYDNACAAYEKAIEMEPDFLFHLNYAVTLYNNGDMDRAKEQFIAFQSTFDALDDEAQSSEQEVLEQKHVLASLLGVQ